MKSQILFLAVAILSATFQVTARDEIKIQKRVIVEPPAPKLTASISTDRSSYRNNELLNISFGTNFDGVVYIFDTDTEGLTRQIFPNYFDKDNTVRANRRYGIPDRSYRLRVAGPAGVERLQILAYPKRHNCFDSYHRFDKNQPYPERKRGAKGMLDQFKQELRILEGKTSTKQESRSGKIGQRIIVEPPSPPLTHYAEATTSFRILSRYPVAPPTPRLTTYIRTEKSSYHNNDMLNITFGTNFDGVVYIFDTDTEGLTRQIFPNYFDKDNTVRANRRYGIPDKNYQLRVAGPAGTERLHIIAYPKRHNCFSDYHQFKKSDPYPIRKKGASEMLNGLKIELKKSQGKGKVSSKSSGRGLGQRVIVETIPEPIPNYAEATTSFKLLPDTPVHAHHGGRLKIVTEPTGARIYIDGEYTGTSPELIEELPTGSYHVRATKRGYDDTVEWVRIRDGKTLSLSIEMKHDKPATPFWRKEKY